ncbi:SDR family oxidoreductase [Xanthobacter dioxanivorans]|uniref:SDR family oxidoreductase n=1 Tax=Xanthobacter dioxanivorans TaxID=2528964 RepID=A0A974PUH3_9HYPH|nr:SDR family oxidoreductase [Xanthobacter dioxanivorans]QRG09320.1 SDR family oxidoreductase [Xanthobacter dioxanivorans]
MFLTGKIAIVTGAGSLDGIGHAAAQLFARHGAQVALVDRDADAVTAAAAAIGEAALPLVADVRSEAACAAAVAAVRERWGRVDVLLNNAGVVQARRTLEISRADYDFVLDVNLRGTLQMSQQVLPLMSRGSAVVCIASVAAQRGGGLMGGPHYAASKGAILALVKSMAREFGPAGVRVNAVNPGVIMTGMTAGGYDDALREKVVATIPLGRFGTPGDVASACLFLASDLSAYITGAAIDVNGGLHIH